MVYGIARYYTVKTEIQKAKSEQYSMRKHQSVTM